MIKKTFIFSSLLAASLIITSPVFAHAVVKPDQAGVGSSQEFSLGFGVEKDIPTTSIRLVIPEGVTNVTPYQKTGWTINVKREGEGEEAKITEITWSGSVSPGLREQFPFRAQVPAQEGNLVWKIYQTYQDGSVQSWDQEPGISSSHSEDQDSGKGPASQTKVVNDLTTNQNDQLSSESVQKDSKLTLILSSLAFVLSVISLGLVVRK